METHTIWTTQQHQDPLTGEHRVQGVAERYGLSLDWVAWLPGGGQQWEVEIPAGQMRGPDGEEREALVYEGERPFIEVVREFLRRQISSRTTES